MAKNGGRATSGRHILAGIPAVFFCVVPAHSHHLHGPARDHFGKPAAEVFHLLAPTFSLLTAGSHLPRLAGHTAGHKVADCAQL